MNKKARVGKGEIAVNEVGAGSDTPAPDTDAACGKEERRAPRKTVATAPGEIVWLFSQSPARRHDLFVGDLEWLVMPPLTAGQYRLFYVEHRPIGIAPFGHQDRMLDELRRTALADRSFRFIRTRRNGRREVVELSGENVAARE